MTAETRDQINLLRFLLIVGLVFLHFGALPGTHGHSPFRGMQAGEHALATFVNSFFLFFFLSAVPLLSAISGYLFFQHVDFSPRFYAKRWRSRAKSILLPMISWNLIILSLFAGIALALPESSLSGIIKYDVLELGAKDWANALFGITRHPINFQFWFLRDLLLTIALSPLLGVLLKRLPWVGLAGLFLVWITGSTLGIYFRTDVLFFFYVGGLLQARGWTPRVLPPRIALIALATYAVLIALRTVAPLIISEASTAGDILYGPVAKLLRVFGVVTAWSVAPLILPTRIGSLILRVSSSAFFLHAIHWPLNQFVKRTLDKILGVHNDIALLAIYFATVAGTIALSLLIATTLSRFAPAIFHHLSGGRTLHPVRDAAAPVASRPIVAEPVGSVPLPESAQR